MSAFTRQSTSSPVRSSAAPRLDGGALWLWLLAAGLVLLYVSPWMTSGSAALTFGGYDLGEWASLPPGVRSENPPLVASFLLRLPLALITLYVAFTAPYRRISFGWWAVGAACLLLVAAQLPPLDFFTTARGDSNYGQQATLALIALVGALVGLISAPGRWRWLGAAAVAAVSAVASVAGVLSAAALMAAYNFSAQPGAAVWLAALLFGVAALWAAFRFVRGFAL